MLPLEQPSPPPRRVPNRSLSFPFDLDCCPKRFLRQTKPLPTPPLQTHRSQRRRPQYLPKPRLLHLRGTRETGGSSLCHLRSRRLFPLEFLERARLRITSIRQ